MTVGILCLIGLPGAGKSCLAGELKDFLSGKFIVFVIAYDDWLNGDGGGLKEKRREILNRVRSKVVELRSAFPDKDVLLILDDNFYYRSMRYEVFRMARHLGNCAFIEVCLDQSLGVCVERNASRGDRMVPVETIRRMHGLLEKPDAANAWERFSLVLNGVSSDGLALTLSLIQEAFLSPVLPLPSRTVSPELVSKIHVADLALRKIVSRLLSEPPVEKSEPERLVSMKKDLLASIRSKEIILPEVEKTDQLANYYDFLMPYFN